MVQYGDRVDRAVAALADPPPRGNLERLSHGSATISELSEPFGISLTGLKKHVQVLEDAGLVRTEKVGRSRVCSLGADDLADVQRWVDNYRQVFLGRLDRLGELLEETKGDQS